MPFKSFGEAVQYAYGKAYAARRDTVVLLDAVRKQLWALVGPHRPFVKLDRHAEWFRVTENGKALPGKVSRPTVLALLREGVLSVDDADLLLG
jgi:hypothetical protein